LEALAEAMSQLAKIGQVNSNIIPTLKQTA
jgi:hypothetical protein